MTAPAWAGPALARAGLLDLRVGRRAASALRSLAAEAGRLAPGRVALVALHGSRARGLGRRESDYDLVVVIEGGAPSPGFADDLADLCAPHVLDGLPVHAAALEAPGEGVAPSALLADALRDGIAVLPRADGAPSARDAAAA